MNRELNAEINKLLGEVENWRGLGYADPDHLVYRLAYALAALREEVRSHEK